LPDDNKLAQIQQIRKSSLAQLRAILSPAQQNTLDSLIALQAARVSNADAGPSYWDLTERIPAELSLNNLQSENGSRSCRIVASRASM